MSLLFNEGTSQSTPAPDKALHDVLAELADIGRRQDWPPQAVEPGHGNHPQAHASACYAYPQLTCLIGVRTWPWAPELFQVEDPRTNFVRAAALLLDEIRRIDREQDRRQAKP